jgi:cysteinyl-tRNA synthetase
LIELFNTISGKKDKFVPIEEGKAKIYVCGLTVQDRPHIGHMRAYITSDVLKRYFEYCGYDVTHVQNFTDIDDKVIKKSKESGEDFRKIARKNTEEYLKSSDNLNIIRADYYPEATKHIQEIQEMVTRLLENGLAYVSGKNVYFEVSKFRGYGKLSGKKLDELRSGARVEPDKTKKNPEDFALWKGRKPGEPWWESPWGRGRPGWHIECSAMSTHYLGDTFDIHMGGEDLIFPHHENEIAQSEGATGKKFVNYWVHNGFLNLSGEKMSKSIGNIILINEILENYEPDVVRLYILSTHYRSPIDYYEQRLSEQIGGYQRLKQVIFLLSQIKEKEGKPDKKIIDKFKEAMDDDLNTPRALSVIYDYVKDIFETFEKNPKDNWLFNARATLREMLNVLGLFQKKEIEYRRDEEFIDLLVKVRSDLRNRGLFDVADNIRDELLKLNISIEDTPGRSRWKRQ